MPAWPSSGGVRTRARDFQGVEAPWPLVFSRKATDKETKDRTMLRFGEDRGEGESGTRRCGGIRDGQPPPRGRQGPGCRPRAAKGGGAPAQERRQTQARGVGNRDEQRLAGGGCEQIPGGRRFPPGEEVGSG